ncbi:MAG: class I SAM-dependent methyltransferase [Candidatus Tritonobacter lacicola]|nr:class I SAM-dependent methyltransferase [Candidatus Tritonobacter lacicola]
MSDSNKPAHEGARYWFIRSKKYDGLEWVHKRSLISAIIKAGEFEKDHLVLDVGTGTGAVARSVSRFVREVIGIDKSAAMMKRGDWGENRYFVRRDIREPLFRDGVFDRITARMVFHHILEGTRGAMRECCRVLKKGGLMVLVEGVPPSEKVKEDFTEIFKLKEERLTFMGEDLVALMKGAGFKKTDIRYHVMRHMSVKNWLDKSGLPTAAVNKIYDMHRHASPVFGKCYNMVITPDDCLIDMKMAIVVGEKQ